MCSTRVLVKTSHTHGGTNTPRRVHGVCLANAWSPPVIISVVPSQGKELKRSCLTTRRLLKKLTNIIIIMYNIIFNSNEVITFVEGRWSALAADRDK